MKRIICILIIIMTLAALFPASMFAYGENCTEHIFETFSTEPTCTEDGYITYVCMNCGYEYTDDETPSLGHDLVYVQPVPPTCDKSGVMEVIYCNICGEILKEWEDIPATGHKWICENEDEYSLAEYSCSVCGDISSGKSVEYIELETIRLLKDKEISLEMKNVTKELFSIFDAMTEAEKMLVTNKDILICAYDRFILYEIGDIDLSGKIDQKDLSLLIGAYGEEDSICDINEDGRVNSEELSLLLCNYLKSCF